MFFFFFNDTATTEISTLSLHDALPISLLISSALPLRSACCADWIAASSRVLSPASRDRKSTRLNSSHSQISYAVFCLKKKNALQSEDNDILSTSHAIARRVSRNMHDLL